MSQIKQLKNTLRKSLKQKLTQIESQELHRQSDKVFQKLTQLKEFQNSENISVYISMESGEIQTRQIIEHIFKSNKNCFIPQCDKINMKMLKLNSWDEFVNLKKNSWGIPEPEPDSDLVSAFDLPNGLDLIIMPGVAFDRSKNRLGHGKGYYDNFLAKHKQLFNRYPAMVAISLTEQVQSEPVPVDEHDVKLDKILTCDEDIE